MRDISKFFISADASIHEAMQRINANGRAALLIIDSDRYLQRTVTDGDLRRLLLSEVDPKTTTLQALPQKTPIEANTSISKQDALQLMKQHDIQHLPLVDEQGRVVDLLERSQLDAPIYLSPPHMGDMEADFVNAAFETNWIAPLGPNVDAFEAEFAEYLGVKAAAAVSSGTAAIHLALRLLDVSAGDVVFCSSLTFVASANPVLYQGATPVFIDSEFDTWNMCPQALAKAFEAYAAKQQLPKAVIVVNLYGQSAKYDEIVAICKQYQVPIIEDAAESLGATYQGQASGSFGTMGIYSFNGNKIITTSGGGMLVADDPELIRQAKFLATQAKDSAPYYQHTTMGYNYRMSNILAGVGRGQLKVLNDRVAARRTIFQRYQQACADLATIEWMPEYDANSSATRWLSVMRLNPNMSDITADQVINCLAERQIEARRVWKPLHLQPLFVNNDFFTTYANTSCAEQLFQQGVCLPSGSSLTVDKQDYVIDALRSVFE